MLAESSVEEQALIDTQNRNDSGEGWGSGIVPGQLLPFRLLVKGLELYDKAVESGNGHLHHLKLCNASNYETALGVAMNHVPDRERSI